MIIIVFCAKACLFICAGGSVPPRWDEDYDDKDDGVITLSKAQPSDMVDWTIAAYRAISPLWQSASYVGRYLPGSKKCLGNKSSFDS